MADRDHSAALPDVRERVAIAVWHRDAPDSHESWEWEPDKERYYCIADAAIAALEAALRSREGERAEPADGNTAESFEGFLTREYGPNGTAFALLAIDAFFDLTSEKRNEYWPRLSRACECGAKILRPGHDHRPAQPEEAAQRPTDLEAVFEKIAHLPRVTWDPEADEPGSEGSYPEYVDVQDVLEIVLAAQRVTPSAPTPNDEKRAALADPSGLPGGRHG